MHGWRWAAGVCLGLACATKWTGVYYIAAFGLMVVLWDFGARRAAGVRQPYAGTIGSRRCPRSSSWSWWRC